MLSLTLASLVGLLIIVKFLRGGKSRVVYPPGPKPRPIVGNAYDFPQTKAWVKYMELSKQFNSGIIHMSAWNTHIFVLNTMEDTVALFDKRSSTYSSRPILEIRRLIGVESVTSSLPYGDEWRQHRKIFQDGLRKDIIPSYNQIHTEDVNLLLWRLLHDPARFEAHCKMLASGITLGTAFGYEKHDHVAEIGDQIGESAKKLLTPGGSLIYLFPILGRIPPWVPGATTQKLAAKIRKIVTDYKNEPFEYVLNKMATGTSKDCMLKKLLERDSTYDENILKDAMATLYFAGAETLQSGQTTFIFTMTLHPREQRKAQEEIDRVVGSSRLPTFEDRASLPYVEALYREVLRWRPLVLLNAVHCTVQDDIYKGFHIPKGAIVLANIWAISRDETVYHNPDCFVPERFLTEDGSLNKDTVNYAFGFGRRVCAGKHLAEATIWLMMVSVLSTFNIAKAVDDDGNEINVDPNGLADSFISRPLPFKCSITPRSQGAEALIRAVAGTNEQQ